MNLIQQINIFLAESIGSLNGALAILLVFLGLVGGVSRASGVFVGLLTGVATAIAVCGVLALLIQIRDLLTESLKRQQDNSGDPPGHS